MRICQIMAGNEDGGLETHFVDLANGLAALGDEVTAIAHPRYGSRFDPAVRVLPLDLARGRRNPFLRRALRRELARNVADVIHAHAGKAASLVAACRPKTPTVGTIHGLKRELSPYRSFQAVIGVSAGALAHLDHPRKRVVLSGVPPAPPSVSGDRLRERFGIDAAQSVTLAVGRLVPVKGYDRLIEKWNEALGHLLVLGDGPERRRLAHLAEGKPVTLAGFQEDARAIMGGADLVVFASDREAYGYALVEALHARVPVVATRAPGPVELLPPRQVVAAGELQSAVAGCLADLGEARERMRPVFDWAAKTLTVERMASQTRRVYEEVLADGVPC